jgi:hypothetical protein
MKLNYSKKILIVSIVVFLGILAVDIIFTGLLLNKIASINNKIKQLNISTKEREAEFDMREILNKTEAERNKLESYFLLAGNAETVKFTEYLENLAKNNVVKQTKTLSYESINNVDLVKEVSVIRYKFNVLGQWGGVLGFLHNIENLSKINYLNSITINNSPDGKIWSADVDFSVITLIN